MTMTLTEQAMSRRDRYFLLARRHHFEGPDRIVVDYDGEFPRYAAFEMVNARQYATWACLNQSIDGLEDSLNDSATEREEVLVYDLDTLRKLECTQRITITRPTVIALAYSRPVTQ